MKILVITPTFLPIVGGVELGIHEIFNRIGKSHEVKILTPKHSSIVYLNQGSNDPSFKNSNYQVCYFKDIFNTTKLPGKRMFLSILPPVSFSYIWSIFRQIKNFKPDLIVIHYIFPSGISLPLIRMLSSTPTVLSLVSRDDVLNNTNKLYKKHTKLFWKILKSPTCIVANSKYYVGRFSNILPVTIIPYGCDTKAFCPELTENYIKKKHTIRHEQKTLFALQRLVKVKQVDLLLKSLKIVLEKKDVLLIIGGKGPEEDNLKKLSDQLGITSNIIFKNYIPEKELPYYFSMADLFVFTSKNETFGIVLAQSLASGTPVVAFNSTAIPEVIDNGKNGILIDSINPEKLANAILNILENKKKLDYFSQNGRTKAIKRYDWDIISEQYNTLFKSIVNN